MISDVANHPLSKVILLCACVVVTGAMLVVGLWPLQFSPPNRVRPVPGVGLVFDGHAAVYTSESFQWRNPTATSRTVELWLRPQQEPSHTPYILCTAQNNREVVLVGQWRSLLILQWYYRDQQGNLQRRKLGVAGAFSRGQWRYIVVTSGPTNTNIYVDGSLRTSADDRVLAGGTDERVLLGNSMTGREDWHGELRAIAFYQRVLTPAEIQDRWREWAKSGLPPEPEDRVTGWYRFDESIGQWVHDSTSNNPDFYLPAKFHPLRRTTLRWDFRSDRSGIKDAIVNLVGFVPFGFVISLYLVLTRHTNALLTILGTVALGVALSLAIEVTQSFLPARSSSSTDLLMNTLGTLFGAALLLCLLTRLRTPPTTRNST